MIYTHKPNSRAPGVDFGYPFLFPVPGTTTAAEHQASAHEVALLTEHIVLIALTIKTILTN